MSKPDNKQTSSFGRILERVMPKRDATKIKGAEAEVQYILTDLRARVFFIALLGVLGVLLAVVLRPYLAAIILAGLTAIVSHPLYTRFKNKLGWSDRVITVLLVGFLLICAIVPLLLVTRNLLREVVNLQASLSAFLSSPQGSQIQAKIQTIANAKAGSVSVNQTATAVLAQLNGALVGLIAGAIGTIVSLTINTTIFLVFLVYLIPRMSRFKGLAMEVSPLGKPITAQYIQKIRLLLRGTVVGTFAISLSAAIIMGLTFWLLGIPNAVLFATLAFVLGFIPYLGTWLFTTAAAIVFVLLGQYTQAAVLMLVQIGILNQLDLVFRPLSIPKSIRIHPSLMIIAVTGGLAAFGMIGIIFGPAILVLFISSVQIYRQNFVRQPKPASTPRLAK